MWKDIFDAVLEKIEKAEAKDAFYLCMALGTQRVDPSLVKSDIYYTLYLTVSKHISEYDLFQISQLSMFFSNP